MKKLLSGLLAATTIGAVFAAVPARAGTICPRFCVLEGAVEGTAIMPDDLISFNAPYRGIDLRNDIPRVSLGVMAVSVTMKPLNAAPSSPQVSVRSGSGTVTVVDDDLASPDRTWQVKAIRTDSGTAGTLRLYTAAANGRSASADLFSMDLALRRTGALTTFVGIFEEHYDGTAPQAPEVVETVTVDPAAIEGTTTTASLSAGDTYRLRASGVVDYDNIRPGQQHADVECSFDSTYPSTVERQSAEVPRWQPLRYLFVSEPQQLVQTDLFDPDPSDDPADLYVAGRAVDWVPDDPASTNRTACNEVDHTYVALFSPPSSGPVNLTFFDLQYIDNGCAALPCATGLLNVSIERVSDRPLPPGDPEAERQPVGSFLVHTNDPDGNESAVLTDGAPYIVEVRGMAKYQGGFGQGFYSDAECSRIGSGDEGRYRPHRFDGFGGLDDPLDVIVDEVAVDWEPLGRTPAGAGSADHAQCSPLHAYQTRLTGSGAPIRVRLLETGPSNYGDDSGTFRVDVFEAG